MSKRGVIEAMLRAGRPDLANVLASVTAAVSIRVDMKGYERDLRDEVDRINEFARKQREDIERRAKDIKPDEAFDQLARFGKAKEADRLRKAWHALDTREFGTVLSQLARWAADTDVDFDTWWPLSRKLMDATRLLEHMTGKDKGSAAGADDVKRLMHATGKEMAAILKDVRGAIKRVEFWNGASVTITPSYTVGSRGNMWDPVTTAYIELGSGRDAPGFSYFGPKQLEDLLHAGDSDFFRDASLEQDYFNLIRELQQPGSTSKPGKIRKLYTARPITDRKQFEKAARAKAMPNNIFLTDSLAEAEGYAAEYAPRDVWLVQIDERYLTKTQERGGMAAGNYQTMGPRGFAPVKRLELLQEG